MDRREMLSALGVSAAALAAVGGGAAHAQHEGHHDAKGHEACQKACQNCSSECNETFHHCYMMVAEGKRDHAKALHLVADCAAFCDLSGALVARNSPLMVHACAACAEACKACAAECMKFDSAQMKDCAKACLTCEKSCREMVKSMGGHAH